MGKYIVSFFILWFSTVTHAATPENGWWWNPSESGRGFNIETQNNTVFIATFVYDEAGGPIWYSGSGELNASDTLNTTLLRSDGGQCIGCPYTAPATSNAVPITVQFKSRSMASLTWAGKTVPIQRFNFAFGNKNQKILGEWVFVEGSPSFPVYFGERLTFSSISGEGNPVGNITGAPERIVVVIPEKTFGYDYFALLDSSTSYYNLFAFSFVGLNKIEGISSTSLKSDTSEEQAQDLASGLPFIAYRNKGVNSGTASVKSVEAQPVYIDYDAINEQKALMITGSSEMSEKSVPHVDEELLELIENSKTKLAL